MSFLLDTDICSAHFRRPAGLAHRFIQHSGRLYISSVNLGELHAWGHGLADPSPILAKIALLLVDVQVLSFDDDCGMEFGRLRGRLARRGISIPTADLMIAATALVHNLTLVTHNTNDYRHVPGLRLDDWLQP